MKINLNSVILDDKGNAIVEKPEQKDKEGNVTQERTDLTIKTILVRALLAYSEQEKVPAEKKFEKYKMAMRLQQSGDSVNLTAEEISMLKTTVGNTFPNPLIVGRSWDILENEIQVTLAE